MLMIVSSTQKWVVLRISNYKTGLLRILRHGVRSNKLPLTKKIRKTGVHEIYSQKSQLKCVYNTNNIYLSEVK